MKNKFIKNTIILILGGLITKILGMIIKIIMTRAITTETLGMYMLITPTLMLLINIASSGIPTAISKLIAMEKTNNKKIIFTIIPLQIILNMSLMIFIFIIAPYLANNLLKNKELYLGIIAIALLIPFTSISAIIRSYFLGKSNSLPIIISNIVELLTKLLIYLYFIPMIKFKSNSYIICILILTNIISEIASIISTSFFLPKNIPIRKKDFIPNATYLRETLSISIPNTTSKLIGNIGYFLEPIILTNTLKYSGYSTKYITYNYGIITGYIIPLIMLPSFFTHAISQALLPAISNEYSKGNIKNIKKKLKISIAMCLIIGFFFTLIFISIPDILLEFIYHTNKGNLFLRILAPIFYIQYIHAPLSAVLEGIGKSKVNLTIELTSTTLRIISLFIFSLFKIGIWPLIISQTISIIFDAVYTYIKVDYFLG